MNKYIIVLVLFVLINTKSYEYTNQTQADIEFEKQKEKCKNADLFSSIETHLTTVTHTVTEGNTELLSELGLPSSAIEQIVKAVETYSNEKVEYIDMRKPNDVFVKIQTTSIRLGMLDSTVYERIKRIYTILPQIGDMGNQAKYIDLSWDKVNYLKLKKNKK